MLLVQVQYPVSPFYSSYQFYLVRESEELLAQLKLLLTIIENGSNTLVITLTKSTKKLPNVLFFPVIPLIKAAAAAKPEAADVNIKKVILPFDLNRIIPILQHNLESLY